jgi:bacterioferritin (cytochrome b1)
MTYAASGRPNRRVIKIGRRRERNPLPLPFQNLDAALDEDRNSVPTVSYHGNSDTGLEFRQSPPEMISRVILGYLFFSFEKFYNSLFKTGGEKMRSIKNIRTEEDAIELMNVALEHEWAVSFEYLFHAYSFPKGKFFYTDPILKRYQDVRAQTIQIGIDEMYHSLQLGVIITKLGGTPSFKTDEVFRYPRIIDNLERDKKTEDLVTDLYQSAEFEEGAFPKIRNMVLNISYDEVRHSDQFVAMMASMRAEGAEDALCHQSDPACAEKEEVRLLHAIMRAENELMHRYLKYVILFSEHQDLSQRLFKNSIDHMKNWDKNGGILIKMGDVIQIEKAEKDEDGVERSVSPMPADYPGEDRLSALENLEPAEKELIAKYEKLLSLLSDGEIKAQLEIHAGLAREHAFTQEWLLKNAQKIKGLK